MTCLLALPPHWRRHFTVHNMPTCSTTQHRCQHRSTTNSSALYSRGHPTPPPPHSRYCGGCLLLKSNKVAITQPGGDGGMLKRSGVIYIFSPEQRQGLSTNLPPPPALASARCHPPAVQQHLYRWVQRKRGAQESGRARGSSDRWKIAVSSRSRPWWDTRPPYEPSNHRKIAGDQSPCTYGSLVAACRLSSLARRLSCGYDMLRFKCFFLYHMLNPSVVILYHLHIDFLRLVFCVCLRSELT